MKFTNDDLNTIIDCIDFVDDNMWEYCEGYDYKVGKLLETTDEKWLT